MDAKQILEKVQRLTYHNHHLNYFRFDRDLNQVEITALKEIFDEQSQFSSKLSQSGSIFITFVKDNVVRYMLEKKYLDEYILANHKDALDAYQNKLNAYRED